SVGSRPRRGLPTRGALRYGALRYGALRYGALRRCHLRSPCGIAISRVNGDVGPAPSTLDDSLLAGEVLGKKLRRNSELCAAGLTVDLFGHALPKCNTADQVGPLAPEV